MRNEYFSEVDTKSKISGHLIDHLIRDKDRGTLVYHDFVVKPVPDIIISMDPFLSLLMGRIPFKSCILIMEPLSCYNWHKDETRGAGINMMVGPGGDPCLFKGDPLSVSADKITVLDYKPDTYYVLNTQNDHMVVNANSVPRLTFSLEFFEDENGQTLSYPQVNEEVDAVVEHLSVLA